MTDKSKPMPPERIAEIRGLLDNTATGGYLWVRMAWSAIDELLGEVERLHAENIDLRVDLSAGRAGEGDETVIHEWATRTPDGTRTGWDNEWRAFRFARHHPHLKVDYREIRHFVGRWKTAPGDTAGEVS